MWYFKKRSKALMATVMMISRQQQPQQTTCHLLVDRYGNKQYCRTRNICNRYAQQFNKEKPRAITTPYLFSQTHLICTVPPYIHQNILKPVTVQVLIISSGKKSEPHTFVYTPQGTYTPLAAATTLSSTNSIHSSLPSGQGICFCLNLFLSLSYLDTRSCHVSEIDFFSYFVWASSYDLMSCSISNSDRREGFKIYCKKKKYVLLFRFMQTPKKININP